MFVVEDEEMVRAGIVKRLSRSRCRVKAFTTGEDVLVALETECPDMVLLDYKLPGLNGEEIMTEMRKRKVTLPVVILTAYPELVNQSRIERDGASTVVPKSLELDDLVQVVKRVLASR